MELSVGAFGREDDVPIDGSRRRSIAAAPGLFIWDRERERGTRGGWVASGRRGWGTVAGEEQAVHE